MFQAETRRAQRAVAYGLGLGFTPNPFTPGSAINALPLFQAAQTRIKQTRRFLLRWVRNHQQAATRIASAARVQTRKERCVRVEVNP